VAVEREYVEVLLAVEFDALSFSSPCACRRQGGTRSGTGWKRVRQLEKCISKGASVDDNEKRTAKVEDQMLEVTRAVLMSLEEVGERAVVPGLVKIQALLLGHLHIDLEGEVGFRGFCEPQYLWPLVPPAASRLFPRRIIRVRMRCAQSEEQAYLVTWITPLLMVS
jgi:hypothetical protein